LKIRLIRPAIILLWVVTFSAVGCTQSGKHPGEGPGHGTPFNSAGGGISADSVTVTAGKATSLDFVYTTKNNGPGKLRLDVFNIGEPFRGLPIEVPMPSGLEVSVKPKELIAYPNHTYHQTISINTSVELPPGTYWLVWQSIFEFGPEIQGALTVTVESAKPPWPNTTVFSDEATTINATVGQRFIIQYDFSRNLFPVFEEEENPRDVVILLSRQGTLNSHGDPPSGTYWFLFQGAQPGSANITLKEFAHSNSNPQSQKTFTIAVSIQNSAGNYTPPITSTPIIMSPANGMTPLNTNFLWLSITGAAYDFQLSTDSIFATTIVNATDLSNNSFVLTLPLSPETVYYWRVRAKTPSSLSSPWAAAMFTTMPQIPLTHP
jgi:hypothetical protein